MPGGCEFQVPGSKFYVPQLEVAPTVLSDRKAEDQSSRSFQLRNLEPGTRNLEHGTRDLEPETWHSELPPDSPAGNERLFLRHKAFPGLPMVRVVAVILCLRHSPAQLE